MPTPATLLFIRHAETDLAGTFCGASDPPLNEKGRAQLAGLIQKLENQPSQPIQAIYTSDLDRARETAEVLAQRLPSDPSVPHPAQPQRDVLDRHPTLPISIPVFRRPALREIDFGDWETLTWQQIEELDPQYAARWVQHFPALPTPNGEHINAFRNRVLTEIDFLRRVPFEHIAIVTHAGVLRVLLEAFGHLAPQHAWERTRDYTCTLTCTQRTPTGPLTVLA